MPGENLIIPFKNPLNTLERIAPSLYILNFSKREIIFLSADVRTYVSLFEIQYRFENNLMTLRLKRNVSTCTDNISLGMQNLIIIKNGNITPSYFQTQGNKIT